MISSLNVYYQNKQVGTLALLSNNEIAFQYTEQWLIEGFSISPFSLPKTNRVFVVTKSYFNGLFGVFQDSFVDSWGELLIKRYLKTKNIDYDSLNILEKLAYIGSNPMGGLVYKPSYKIETINQVTDFDVIQEDINNILNNKEKDTDFEKMFKLGGSSSGTRPKILTTYNGKEVMVKFRASFDPIDSVRQEYKLMSLAKQAGINIPNIYLVNGKNGDYFIIERFDRENNEKYHVISVSGLLEVDYHAPSLDYVDLIKLTRIVTNKEKYILEMFRRMVFNVVFENLDDHARNFSFIFKNDVYSLAPAYDITKSTTYFGEHTTSVNGKGKDITREDMLEVAKINYIDLNKANEIIDTIFNLKKQVS